MNELQVFTKYYAPLCNTITDINELLKYFVTEKIITMDEEEHIKACVSKPEKVSKLLLSISGPLKADDSNGFHMMLRIMKTYGIDATQRLADSIIKEIESHSNNLCTVNKIHEDWDKGLFVCVHVIDGLYQKFCLLIAYVP